MTLSESPGALVHKRHAAYEWLPVLERDAKPSE